MKMYTRVKLEDGRRLTLEVTHETERVLVGVQIKDDGDEVTKPGVDILKHVIDKQAIVRRTALVMNKHYGILEVERKPKARIHQNVWGNWYGYLGTRRVIAFGNGPEATAEQAANAWLQEQK